MFRRVGKKAKQYVKAIKEGDKALEGITYCEIQLPNCMGTFGLSRAHRMKRRFCNTEELKIYCLACAYCHQVIEAMSHENMRKYVDRAIERRNEAVTICDS